MKIKNIVYRKNMNVADLKNLLEPALTSDVKMFRAYENSGGDLVLEIMFHESTDTKQECHIFDFNDIAVNEERVNTLLGENSSAQAYIGFVGLSRSRSFAIVILQHANVTDSRTDNRDQSQGKKKQQNQKANRKTNS